MINIDPISRIPVYEQIVTQVEALVSRNALKPGDSLPSVRSLAITLGINPNTIQKAYTELDRRGLLISAAGKGCFVREDLTEFFAAQRIRQQKQFEEVVRNLRRSGVSFDELESNLRKIYNEKESSAV